MPKARNIRTFILKEIRRLAALRGGRAPGMKTFKSATGLGTGAWCGVYWARWGDAVREAGLTPNVILTPIAEDVLLGHLAGACRQFGRFPTSAEFRLYGRPLPTCPHFQTLVDRYGSWANARARLLAWAQGQDKGQENYADVVRLLGATRSDAATACAPQPERGSAKSVRAAPVAKAKGGLVYLMRAGTHWKIGRSDDIDRRLKSIRVTLPDPVTLVHTIRTDDPAGIEAYWHKRFAERRGRGEWFDLTDADIAAFKRRRSQ